jgi:integrase
MNAIHTISRPRSNAPAAGVIPTLADAMVEVASWQDLPKQVRANYRSSLSGIERACGKPADAIELRCESLNEMLNHRTAASCGFTDARYSKIKRHLAHTLQRMGLHDPDLPDRDGLSEDWRRLLDKLPKYRDIALSSFAGYCSAQGIEPGQVTNTTLDQFETWSRVSIIYNTPEQRARRTASNWAWARKNIEGWPQGELQRSGMQRHYTTPLTQHPPSFQADVQRFIDRLAGEDDDEIYDDDVIGDDTPRRRRGPLRPRTIEGRLDHIRKAAAALVLQGMPIEEIRSLQDLVDPPERPRLIRRFYRERFGKEPHAQVACILECLRQIAAFHCRLPKEAVSKMARWAADARPEWHLGMTEKNRERLRALIQEVPRLKLLNFPEELVRRALGVPGPRGIKTLMGRASPNGLTSVAQARLVGLAVAIEILLTFPMRRSNLAGLRLDKHLQWLNPGKPVSHIFLSASEMKNRNGMQFPLIEETASLIEVYLRDFRPVLAEPGNPYLFPVPGLKGRSAHELAISIKSIINEELGLTVNVHLMRHFAAWLHLNRHPGDYETVRQVLGHKSLRVTVACYTGLELDAAARLFDSTVLQERAETRTVAQAVFARPGIRTRRVK